MGKNVIKTGKKFNALLRDYVKGLEGINAAAEVLPGESVELTREQTAEVETVLKDLEFYSARFFAERRKLKHKIDV